MPEPCLRRATLLDSNAGWCILVRVWTATAFLLGSMSLGLGCSDDDVVTPQDDGGDRKSDAMSGVAPIDDGGPSNAGADVPAGGAGGVGGFMFDAGRRPTAGPMCALAVGAQCDGPEDCPVPQSCCGEFEPLRATYRSIGCRLSCDAPTQFELCHVEQGGCKRSGQTCQRSVIIPYDFITICSNALLPAAANNSQDIDGVIVCGSDRCVAGVEECCLRSQYDFANRQLNALDPYCAPRGSACTCSSMAPGGSDDDGGMVSGG